MLLEPRGHASLVSPIPLCLLPAARPAEQGDGTVSGVQQWWANLLHKFISLLYNLIK